MIIAMNSQSEPEDDVANLYVAVQGILEPQSLVNPDTNALPAGRAAD